MSRVIAAILLVAVLAVGGGIIATTAYQAGVSTAVTTGTGGTVVAPVVVPGYGYGWHPFGWGFGLFGLLATLFFVFIVFGLIRAIFWRGGMSGSGGSGGPGRRGWGGPDGSGHSPWAYRAHDTFDDWHKRAHADAPNGGAGGAGEPPSSTGMA